MYAKCACFLTYLSVCFVFSYIDISHSYFTSNCERLGQLRLHKEKKNSSCNNSNSDDDDDDYDDDDDNNMMMMMVMMTMTKTTTMIIMMILMIITTMMIKPIRLFWMLSGQGK